MLGGRHRPKIRAPRRVSIGPSTRFKNTPQLSHAPVAIQSCCYIADSPPQISAQADEIDFASVWSNLEASFQQIHSKNASTLSYEELYRGAYQLVLKKRGEQLYDHVVDFERQWLQNTVQGEVRGLITPDLLAGQISTVSTERRYSGERFLKGIKQQWVDHELGISMISDVTMYLVCLVFAFIPSH
jgi:hypothetical protein